MGQMHEIAPPLTRGSTREVFEVHQRTVRHRLRLGGLAVDASIAVADQAPIDPKGAWWRAYLEGRHPEPAHALGGTLRTVDLFCGPGGLANGVQLLAQELGVEAVSELIADQDEEATIIYAANHASRRRTTVPVNNLIDYRFADSGGGARFSYRPEIIVDDVRRVADGVDLILAGPPCQGHSNLNNRTRRSDPRNSLYLTVPAFAVAAGAPMCIIENVPAVLNDTEGVVDTARALFRSEGYTVVDGMLSASALGWPQTRTRHFLIARRDRAPLPLTDVAATLKDEPRSIWWAIADLEDRVDGDPMTQVTEVSPENQARIDWLFDNEEHDLALEVRPKSHREGTSYTAVYGRLHRDRPSPTITTGFMTPGRGRYTHPTRRRVLTPREAARLQGFPDTYVFAPDPTTPPVRSQLAKWIGDAVPMPLGYAAALSALAEGLPGA